MLSHRSIELTEVLIFDVVSNLYGTSLLGVLQPALKARGVNDPDVFRGRTKEAKKFLEDLGFSQDLISKSEPQKPAREEVIGPVRLKKLHNFQESTSRKIRRLLNGETGIRRGIVQLPTGAGKTRVAAQSVIEHVGGQQENQLVVWIAQSEELCEQAIESWTNVWQAHGPHGERMAIGRLWGGRSVHAEDTRLHLVVATVQTLTRIADDVVKKLPRGAQYAWMENPDLVIIDEAHGAIASSYTSVLKWFKRPARDSEGRLLGLSATPYRGTNAEDTERLVNRFGANLIEPDEFSAEDAHTYLQNAGVLANVLHEQLEGIQLQKKDGSSLAVESFEDDGKNAMLDQRVDLDLVAKSVKRNDQILSHITANKDTLKHTLVFAASVEHAEALAAVLSATGIPAAAISGKTDTSHRRSLIEKFRSGDLQVLTNFDVLSQGFDAPKIDAVYLCRPTFSPNKYIQMVGRGLRGPENGGSKKVMIVNIKDNLDQFGSKLAYTELDYLWNRNAVSGN
jgi:superfamily II DNA or RNA helicase